jgi:DHA2 family multidrug resistance protein
LVAMLASGAQIHQSYLTAHLDPFRLSMLQHAYPPGSSILANFGSNTGGPTLSMLYVEVQRQANVMAFVDDFRLIAYLFFILTPLALFMHKPAAAISASAVA